MASHYRRGLFELLANKYSIYYYFFSDGKEWYWHHKHRQEIGNFRFNYLSGFSLLKIRINRALVSPSFYQRHELIIKCINGKFALLSTFIMSRLFYKPFILWTGIWQHPKTFLHIITFPIVKLIYKNADAIVVYGNHVKKYLSSLGIDEQKIFIAWNTIDKSIFSKHFDSAKLMNLKKSMGIDTDKIILFVGRFEKVKGLFYLLEAFEIVKKGVNAKLLLVGSGTEEAEIKKWMIEQSNYDVLLIDYIENQKLPEYYAIADVFVLPSITTNREKETWGLVLNEAMCQGCPVVTTEAVGAAVGGLVEDGKTGYIVPEKNSGALARAILRILKDDDLHKNMQDASFQKIQSWDYDYQAQGFIDAINYATKSK